MNTTQKESSRDQKWLENRFLILWKDYFSDIPMASRLDLVEMLTPAWVVSDMRKKHLASQQ